MVLCRFLLFLSLSIPLSASPFMPNCDHCPHQSTCTTDSNGTQKCVCNPGFMGDHCEIVLCDQTTCFGPDSLCEDTSHGPLCHCQEGREGSNCELSEGETHPWSTCTNATFCEESHNNGKCDEICNNPECVYDGHDCDIDNESMNEQYKDTFKTSILTVTVEFTPSQFFANRSEWLGKLSAFLNKSVTIAEQDGNDRIFIVDEAGERIIITEDESLSLNSSFVEVDLTIDISECDFNLDECDRTFEELYHSINDSIGSKDLSDLHISSAAVTLRPNPSPSPSSSPIPKILAISSIIGVALILGVAQRIIRKRTRQVDADEYELQTLENSHLPPVIKRCQHQLINRSLSNHIHIMAASSIAIQITNENRLLVSGRDSTGRTPLHVLAALPRGVKSPEQITEDARTLMDNGVDVNAQDDEGNTALHLALCNSRISIVKMLLDHPNVDVKLVNKREQTAMHICASLSDTYNLDLLLTHPGTKDTLEMTDLAHHTPLVINILHSSTDTTFAQKLLLAGASVNNNGDETQTDEDNCERSALHYAAEYGLLGHINLLVQHKAKVNAIDMLRMTPLHYAVKNNRREAVELLLSLGADRGVHSHYNETPVDMARRMGHEEIVNHLQKVPRNKNAAKKDYKKRDSNKDIEDFQPIRSDFNDTGYQTASPQLDIDNAVDQRQPSPSTSARQTQSNTPQPQGTYPSHPQFPPNHYPNSAQRSTNYYPDSTQSYSDSTLAYFITTQPSHDTNQSDSEFIRMYNSNTSQHHSHFDYQQFPGTSQSDALFAQQQSFPTSSNQQLDPSQPQSSLPPLSSLFSNNSTTSDSTWESQRRSDRL